MEEESEEQIDTEPEETDMPETETTEAAPANGTAVSSNTPQQIKTPEAEVPQTNAPQANAPIKKGKKLGGRINKIPTKVLFGPGGVVLIFAALLMEMIDWIPIPGLDSLTWELIIEAVFCALLAVIAGVSFTSMIIPLIIERIPIISDIIPSFLIRLFM
ncbi:MAG: hypothetical protein V1756_01845 [Patescibacteria group bacterium]